MTLRSLTGVLVAALVLAGAAPALAATKNGITPLSPKAGATIPTAQSPTFKMRVKGKGQVWVHACSSKKKNSDGVICDDAGSDFSFGRATKKGSVFQFKAKFFDYDEFWLNNPGTYYWQAHRIQCESGIDDCLQEGPIVKFKVG
jgi:hypothetical protein